ncbi:GTP cyclohydrolase II RibA [Micromonospora sp. WMMC273]|uniref:GTP cyclohydrolase II RibA n=1 Tax=Micromonospora sp. WMMC273 TaxID=3015157 RepID=UPI003FA553F9
MTGSGKEFAGFSATIPTATWGKLEVEAAFLSGAVDGDLVIWFGEGRSMEWPLVRIHSECVFGEVLSSLLCDCSDQLLLAMKRLRQEGGALVYLRMDGRGAGLAAKVAATALELQGTDTWDSRTAIGVEPEGRDFQPVAKYLKAVGVEKIRLLTNNPEKVMHLARRGLTVEREPLVVSKPNENVRRLYKTKSERFGHLINGELAD